MIRAPSFELSKRVRFLIKISQASPRNKNSD